MFHVEQNHLDLLELKAKLLGSLLKFTQFFYKIRTGREFGISKMTFRESHHIAICRTFTQIRDGTLPPLNIIRIPPRYSKTEIAINFIAQSQAMFPDSNSLYISYGAVLATRQTQIIKEIIEMPIFYKLFGVKLKQDVRSKGDFQTIAGGNIYAAGIDGTITGMGAGTKNLGRYGGCILIDDYIKPNEADSDTIRESSENSFYNTILSRRNSPQTPIIIIGQETHEASLTNKLAATGEWNLITIPSLDENLNALWPEMHTKEQLLKMQETQPYVFAAQYQQNPQPSGGGIYKPEWFVLLDEEPEILATFITADTAETDKNYNDATAFSLWGIYKIKQFGEETEIYGLHWMACQEIRVEPRELKAEFMQFYADGMRHHVKPKIAILEKKSTGVTLISVMEEIQGLRIIDIKRTSSKISRFLGIQEYVASKQISLMRYAKHTPICIEHMRKITANCSHRFDDICDTVADAVQAALIDKTIIYQLPTNKNNNELAKKVTSSFAQQMSGYKRLYSR